MRCGRKGLVKCLDWCRNCSCRKSELVQVSWLTWLEQMTACGQWRSASTFSVGWRKRWAACRECVSSGGTWRTRPGAVSSSCGWISSASTGSTPATSDRAGCSTARYRSRSTNFTRRRRRLPGTSTTPTASSSVRLSVTYLGDSAE